MSINSSQVAGKRKIDPSVEKTNTNEQKRQKIKEEETSDDVFGATGPGGLALGNPIILEKIVGFLDAGDFCRWYDSSRIFKDQLDQIDDIFWKRQAQTLAAVLKKKSLEKWPGKTYRDIFFILKSIVERLVVKIKAILDPLPFDLKVTYIADAARLAHHGLLGSLRRLSLNEDSLKSIPIKHMTSLVACVKDEVQIEDVPIGLSVRCILDNVQCESLSLDRCLVIEETQALVRAMRTRVGKVCVPFGGLLDDELTKYDGKGKCEQVNFLEMDNHMVVEFQIKQELKLWVKRCEWQVLADEEDFLLGKPSELKNCIFRRHVSIGLDPPTQQPV